MLVVVAILGLRLGQLGLCNGLGVGAGLVLRLHEERLGSAAQETAFSEPRKGSRW